MGFKSRISAQNTHRAPRVIPPVHRHSLWSSKEHSETPVRRRSTAHHRSARGRPRIPCCGQPTAHRPRRFRRQTRVENRARRPRNGTRTGCAESKRSLDRLAGNHRHRRRPLRTRRHAPGAGALELRRLPDVLRGLFQRHPVAAVPRRHRPTGIPPHVVGQIPRSQHPLCHPHGRNRWQERNRVGARLPAVPGSPAAAVHASGRQHRILPAHPVPAGGALQPAAVALRDSARSPGCRPHRLPAAHRCRELPPLRAQALRLHHQGRRHHRHGRSRLGHRRAHHAGRPLPHFRRHRCTHRTGEHPRDSGPGAGNPPRTGQPGHYHPRHRPHGLHQGSAPPSESGSRTSARRAAGQGQGHVRADRHPQPRKTGPLQADPHGGRTGRRPHQWRVLRPAQPGHPLLPLLVPTGRNDGLLPGGRCHARHPAARRHEPRGEGVHGLPHR